MAEVLVSIAVKVARQQLSLFAGTTRELEKLSSTFESIKPVLDDAESRQVDEKHVQLWLSRLRHAAYDVEDLLEDASNHAVSRYNIPHRIRDRYKVAHRIKEIRERLDQIDDERNRFDFSNSPLGGDQRMLVRSQRLTTLLMDESEMVFGRENDKKTLVSKLLSERSTNEDQRQVQVVSIAGIGGLGKTTLARQISHDGKVQDYFARAVYWVCVSDVFDVIRLTKEILEQVKGKNEFPTKLDALQNELLEALRGKRFLIVLDDVWNDDAEKWEMLRLPLTSGTNGSKILVTTCSEKVAETMDADYIHKLKGLSDDQSWMLFSSRAFAGWREGDCYEFESIGREIVHKCEGVPLSINVTGSAMNTKRTVEDWKKVLESKIWSLREATDKIPPALLLTYCNLPSHLKPCFAYCSIFPKDWWFEKDVLVRLWVAQSFIQSEGNKENEDIGDESERNREKEDIGDKYFDELVAWSMFQEVKETNEGKIICKMHDLLHDLAEFIVKDEICTFISQGGKSEAFPSDNSNIRHAFLSFVDNDDNLSILMAACRAKKLRTLWLDGTIDGGIIGDLFHEARFLRALYFSSSTTLPKSISKLKHLRFLDLSNSAIVKLPDAIGKMKQLRYLDLSGNQNIVELPESVSDLHNLHTLNLRGCNELEKLPRGIGRMVSLRHLEIKWTDHLQYLPEGLGKINGLRSLSKFIVGGGDEGKGCGIHELQTLNSLQGTLEIEHLERVLSQEETRKAKLWNKQYLCSLVLEMSKGRDDDTETRMIDSVLEGLQPHENLQKLKIFGFTGSKLPSWMNVLLCLRKLVLFSGPKLERVPCLPNLRKFDICELRNEILPDEGWEQLVALQKLSIQDCRELERLPDGLTQLPSLENLHISWCDRLESLPVSCGQLKKLKSLHVGGSNVLRCLPDSLGRLESLEHLQIYKLKKLESLPDSLGELNALSHLDIGECGALASLPQGLRHLLLLQSLVIQHCPLLSKRCKREGGVDWPNISHIPYISVNGQRI